MEPAWHFNITALSRLVHRELCFTRPDHSQSIRCLVSITCCWAEDCRSRPDDARPKALLFVPLPSAACRLSSRALPTTTQVQSSSGIVTAARVSHALTVCIIASLTKCKCVAQPRTETTSQPIRSFSQQHATPLRGVLLRYCSTQIKMPASQSAVAYQIYYTNCSYLPIFESTEHSGQAGPDSAARNAKLIAAATGAVAAKTRFYVPLSPSHARGICIMISTWLAWQGSILCDGFPADTLGSRWPSLAFRDRRLLCSQQLGSRPCSPRLRMPPATWCSSETQIHYSK